MSNVLRWSGITNLTNFASAIGVNENGGNSNGANVVNTTGIMTTMMMTNEIWGNKYGFRKAYA